MIPEKYYYLIINILVISIPLLLSFDKKVHFYKRYRQFLPSLLIVALSYILWDVLFTAKGIWGFNYRYLTGIRILNLPLEEVLFFITIPYACTFIYDTIKAYWPDKTFKKTAKIVYPLVGAFTLFFFLFHIDKWYSSTTAAIVTIALILIFKNRTEHAGRIAVTYAISIVPFLLVNGLLTGSWIDEPIVWYDLDSFSGIRIGTIPLEDFFYGFSLITINIRVYETFIATKFNSLQKEDSQPDTH
jgi:lycopene cyclase domain-containing protein